MARRPILIGTTTCLVVLAMQPAHTSPVAAADDLTCFGMPATIVGTEGDDHLVGTDGPDVIVGLGGADLIEPGTGDDRVCAGPNPSRDADNQPISDIITEGTAPDSGNDLLSGGDGADRIEGGTGSDRIY